MLQKVLKKIKVKEKYINKNKSINNNFFNRFPKICYKIISVIIVINLYYYSYFTSQI
jgi:hypothetical protein